MNSRQKSVFYIMLVSAGFILAVACGESRGINTKGDSGGQGHVSSGIVAGFPVAGGDGRSYDTIRMGRMAEGEVIQGTFEIENQAPDKPLVIVQIITGCGCTTVDFDSEPISPGESRTVTYRFDSKGRLGQQFKSIEVISAERQVAGVYLQGEVYAE